MFENLRAGDWIVIAFGVIGICKWFFETLARVLARRDQTDEELGVRVNRYRSEFLVHQATDESEFRHVKDTLARMDRKLDQVAAQVRNLATNGHNRVFTSEERE